MSFHIESVKEVDGSQVYTYNDGLVMHRTNGKVDTVLEFLLDGSRVANVYYDMRLPDQTRVHLPSE